MDQETSLDLKTPAGSLKNIPVSLLGWLVVAGLATFLMLTMTGSLEDKITKMSNEMPVQTMILKEILNELKNK